ncbi:dihydrolipoyl transsuccinylase Ecym_4259 [Eremothecium cymbalariae DBVPG|uniref:dihydrolipoyllysine-residue succinyltransferase n=1 Tax=Eremothecium cymbalariae (strain CBS 270.75 / DBVPG 7215 / KCTC 17166 / NRRL Y-17582) TaxID=931890 RepID=G8JTH0_ERECY|nr:hypothetical protein Ecym_4259 [Eremothecium cymbalariae DBVPG\
MLRSSVRSSFRSLRPSAIQVYQRAFSVGNVSKQVCLCSNILGETVRMPVLQKTTFRYGSTSVPVPPMAESLTEGSLKEYTKQVGEYVAQDELLATIETDKIDIEVNSPISGTITKLNFQPEDTVTVGDELAQIEEGGEPAAASASKPEVEEATTKKEESGAPAAPAAAAPPKVSSADAKKPTPAVSEPVSATAPQQALGNFSRTERRVKMNRMRMRIAERLKESQNTTASLTTFNEVDMSALLEMRKLYKDEIIKNKGVKFGFMGLFSKAVALAQKDVPSATGGIEGDQIVYRDYTDISIAVATPKGLVTPVVRNVESLSVLEIEEEIVRLSKKARDGKITLEDMAGGNFTISNGGVFGSLYGTPIINTPQTAVLGLHGVKERPVTVNGNIVSRPMMYLALTYDHRLLDGREAVTFLKTIKELIEDPRKMLLM